MPRNKGAIAEALTREQGWLVKAHPGDQRVYHSGLLVEDRQETVYTTTERQPDGSFEYIRATAPVEPFDSVANLYERAASDGLVLLFQRRIGPAHYDYIAVRTSKET